jgi:integrase
VTGLTSNTSKTLKIHINNKKVFYSFRHTFATELNKSQVDIRFIEQLSGREINTKKSVGEKTYIDDASSIELLEQLKKLDFSKELTQVQKWPDQNQNPIP